MRVPNWDVELAVYTNLARREGFAWGHSDCLLYAFGGVEVQTGVDFAKPYRGTYSDEAGARRVMAANAWADVDAVTDAFLPRIDLAAQRRGHILLIPGELGNVTGISMGRFCSVMTPEGAGYVASARATAAWRVG